MAIWTLDKFVRQEHTSAVFQKFYMMPDLSQSFSYLIGMIQGLIVLGVIVGFKKKFTYGATLILHTISTLNSYSQYLNPWEGANILFFAAWPMLAATLALFLKGIRYYLYSGKETSLETLILLYVKTTMENIFHLPEQI